MSTLRSKETQKSYERYRQEQKQNTACVLCERIPIEDFKYWKIITNHFPYDAIASTHHMLVSHRHVLEAELTEDEEHELQIIKNGFVNDNYDYMIETCNKTKTIPNHFHIQLIIAK